MFSTDPAVHVVELSSDILSDEGGENSGQVLVLHEEELEATALPKQEPAGGGRYYGYLRQYMDRRGHCDICPG